MMTGISDPRLRIFQPCEVMSAPDPNEVNAMVPNTKKLIDACALSRSLGLYAVIAKEVEPVNKKFHPTPSKNKAIKNW